MIFPWDQKYAPTELHNGEFIWASAEVEQKIKLFTHLKYFSHLFLWGVPGVGKSTIADLLPRAIAGPECEGFNNAVFTFRARTSIEATKDYSQMIELPKRAKFTKSDRCYIVIHEIDQMGEEKISFLKNTLDRWSNQINTFVPWMMISTSNTSKVPIAVKERMMSLEITRPSLAQLVAHGQAILAKEGATLPVETIEDLARYANFSPRLFLKKLGEEVMMEMV